MKRKQIDLDKVERNRFRYLDSNNLNSKLTYLRLTKVNEEINRLCLGDDLAECPDAMTEYRDLIDEQDRLKNRLEHLISVDAKRAIRFTQNFSQSH